jgi:hypothetical protein
MNFTAIIECGFLYFEVFAYITDEGEPEIEMVCLDGKPLLIDQEIHFQDQYGLDELKAEVMTQYHREMKLQDMDQAGLEWEEKNEHI